MRATHLLHALMVQSTLSHTCLELSRACRHWHYSAGSGKERKAGSQGKIQPAEKTLLCVPAHLSSYRYFWPWQQELYSFILTLQPLLLRLQIILCWKIFHMVNFRKGLHCKIRVIKKKPKNHPQQTAQKNQSFYLYRCSFFFTFRLVCLQSLSPRTWLYIFKLTPFRH